MSHQLKPNRWSELKNLQVSIKKLRNLAREQILKRFKMMEDNIELPNDMLTLFFKEQSS